MKATLLLMLFLNMLGYVAADTRRLATHYDTDCSGKGKGMGKGEKSSEKSGKGMGKGEKSGKGKGEKGEKGGCEGEKSGKGKGEKSGKGSGKGSMKKSKIDDSAKMSKIRRGGYELDYPY